MWINPLAIYSKEIIMKNGSTVFGKIVYQDESSLKVETLVGYLIINRKEIVRIVDNVVTEEQAVQNAQKVNGTMLRRVLARLALLLAGNAVLTNTWWASAQQPQTRWRARNVSPPTQTMRFARVPVSTVKVSAAEPKTGLNAKCSQHAKMARHTLLISRKQRRVPARNVTTRSVQMANTRKETAAAIRQAA
jgi:hypothetical protein